MPLTVSHAAVAWPIRRVLPTLPFSALVIGSLSPDFEYWFRLAPSGRLAHAFVGVWVFCLPLSMAVWVVFRDAVRPAILDLLPPAMAGAVPAARGGVLPGIAACVIGALSHIAWDGVTHASDWGVRHIPALRDDVVPGLPWFHLLQHASTVVGLIWISWATWRWVFSHPPEVRRFERAGRTRALWALALVGVPAIAGGVLNGWRGYASGGGSLVVGIAAVGVLMGLTVGLAALALAHRARIARSD